MQISRHGTWSYHGKSIIELNSPDFSWDSKTSCVIIRQSRIRDFSGSSHHDYTISLSLDDVQRLLLTLSEGASSEPVAFEKALESSLKHLTRLQAIAAGIVPSQRPDG